MHATDGPVFEAIRPSVPDFFVHSRFALDFAQSRILLCDL